MRPVRIRICRCFPLLAAVILAAALIADCARVFAYRRKIQADFLRLHVIAASDSQTDQRLKLAVRDAVLSTGAALFDGSLTAEQAESRLSPRLAALQYAAEKTLRSNGCFDRVRVELKKEYFPERIYENITLPPGIYKAVKVTIGKGEGHNWWCVIFPPVCLPESSSAAVETLDRGERNALTHPERYRIRFKTAQIAEDLYYKLKTVFQQIKEPPAPR